MKWYKLYNKIISTNILTQPNLIFKFSLILPWFIIKVFNDHKIMKN